MSNEALFVIGISLVILVLGFYSMWDLNKERAKEELDILADLEHEKTQPMCRIKLTTERSHMYTKPIKPYILLGTVMSSKEAAKRRLDGSMRAGFFTTDEDLYIPTCNVLAAEIIDYEPVK